ncbi:MAG: ankyrin repeat domain-containing protein [Sulfurimonadaceae bacterium]|nr:ankyrin repeat domain-containing protein [Sulfurimonadaceae bacterium]
MKYLLLFILVLPLTATELHNAVKKLDAKKTEKLLKEGADINALDAKGETVMHIAARYGRLSMIRLLLEYNPDLYIENKRGYTPLGIVISRNYVKSMHLILKAQQKQEYRLDMLPIHKAVANNEINRLLILVRDGFDVDAPNSKGITPLHLAAKLGNAPMVDLLIHYGADVFKTDNEGRDALYYARYSNEGIVKAIIMRERKRQSAKR